MLVSLTVRGRGETFFGLGLYRCGRSSYGGSSYGVRMTVVTVWQLVSYELAGMTC